MHKSLLQHARDRDADVRTGDSGLGRVLGAGEGETVEALGSW